MQRAEQKPFGKELEPISTRKKNIVNVKILTPLPEKASFLFLKWSISRSLHVYRTSIAIFRLAVGAFNQSDKRFVGLDHPLPAAQLPPVNQDIPPIGQETDLLKLPLNGIC